MKISHRYEVGFNSVRKEAEIKKLGPPKCILSLNGDLLYPTQNTNEFKPQTLENVRQKYLTKPNFLEDTPLACCAYPLNSEHISSELVEEAPYIFLLMDGHHRLKVGRDEFDRINFPVEVFSIFQAHQFYHDRDICVTMEKLFRWAMESSPIQKREQLVIVRFVNNQLRIGV